MGEPKARQPVTSKQQMYRLLAAGAFGNTIRQAFSVAEWEASPEHALYEMWGVRTLTPGGPCRLFCPRDEVRATAEQFQAQGHPINISMMVDAVAGVLLFADIEDVPGGPVVYGVECPGKGASWRQAMPIRGKHYTGLAARMLLRRHLNAASLEDVWGLLEAYPGHIVELSALDRCLGTVPGRNHVVWECRRY